MMSRQELHLSEREGHVIPIAFGDTVIVRHADVRITSRPATPRSSGLRRCETETLQRPRSQGSPRPQN